MSLTLRDSEEVTTYLPTSTNPPSTTVMRQEWRRLTFLHWSYDPAVVQALLPEGVTVDTYDGRAWVALVPFEMVAKAPVGPPVPWASNFWETNVRTYVRGPDGRTGVWFLSLEASRFGAMAAARIAYSLPYYWARMRLVETSAGRELLYVTHRRWPGPPAESVVQVRVGAAFEPDELTEFDHFLTARFALWAKTRRGLRWTPADHAPWPLYRAQLLRLDDSLMTAAGLPEPEGDPILHHSPGVAVRIGRDSWHELAVSN
ncbi:DUF2071 domain-containing protein [Acidothermaceae bacterium B102]|nr:DUF2071 domain-containing protein [Acidothermaceae bacterium B102]